MRYSLKIAIIQFFVILFISIISIFIEINNSKKTFNKSIKLATPMPFKDQIPIGESYIIENIRLIDGDTINADILLGCQVVLKNQYIRFAEINAPEIKGEEKKRGFVSKNFVEDILKHPVYIYIPDNKKGKFGRWIAYVYSDYQMSINEMMIEGGYAVLEDYN